MQKNLPLRYRLLLHQGWLAVRESVAHSLGHHARGSRFRTPHSPFRISGWFFLACQNPLSRVNSRKRILIGFWTRLKRRLNVPRDLD